MECFIFKLVTSSVFGDMAMLIPTENTTPATVYRVFRKLSETADPQQTATTADAIRETVRYAANLFMPNSLL